MQIHNAGNPKISMKNIIIILAIIFLYLPLALSQGITNNGGYIKISQGAIVRVNGSKGGFVNGCSGALNGKVHNDGKMYVQGKWENNAPLENVFSSRNGIGVVEFNGPSPQTIGGLQMTYFENLTINNSSGVTLGNDERVDSILTLKSGIVSTATNKVIVLNTNANAISLHSVSNYINGNLRRYVTGGLQYDLPVGTAAQYELSTVNITTLGALSYLDASFRNASPGAVPVGLNIEGTLISEFLDYGYWRISPDNDLATVYDITVTSAAHTNGAATPSSHALFYRSNGGAWQNFGVHNNATQSGTGTNPVTAKRTVASNFYEYVIGKSEEGPLAIDLLHFYASCNNDQTVDIIWATSSEMNNDFFTVYKSIDGETWNEFRRIPGAGNSNQVIHYSVTDEEYLGNTSYYQLKQTDYDGSSTLFNISSANCYTAVEPTAVIFPNPFNAFLSLTINDASQISKVEYRMYNDIGEEVVNIPINTKTTTIETGHLPSGIYFYKVIGDDKIIQSGKLVSQE